jgi:Tfp pilus assembly PilM family ATPase
MHKTIKRSFVRVSLPEEQVYIFNVTIPSMKSGDVRNAIMLQLEDHVPVATIDAVFDYDLFIQTDTEMTFQVAVISQAVIDSYFTLCSKDTGFTPLSFELEAQSIARAIVPEEDKRAFMVIDFGETRTGISVVYKGLVLFTSTIDVGGHNLTEADYEIFFFIGKRSIDKEGKIWIA